VLQFLKLRAKQHPARVGAIAGLFQQGSSVLVALLLIPVVTQYLSSDEAGIWFSFQGLVSMISMLDLGFGFAIARQAAFTLGANSSTIANDDFIHLAPGWSGVAQLFDLTRTLYRALAGAALVIGIFAFEVFSRVGSLVPASTQDVRWCWYGMVAASSLLILATGQSSFLNGLGAVYQTRFLLGFYLLLAGTGAAFAAWKGWGLVAMGASFALSSVVYWLSIDMVRRATTAAMLEAKVISSPQGSFKRLVKAALPVGGVNVFGSLVYTAQAPILGMLLGPEKVAPFYLAQRIAMACNMVAMQFILAKLPFFTRALGAGDFVEAKANMKQTILRTSLLVGVSTAAFYLLSPWAAGVLLHKTTFVEQETLLLMAIDLLFLGCTVIWGHYVLAEGRNPFVISTILTGFVSVCLTTCLTPLIGTTGLPLSTLVAGLAFNYRRNLAEGISTLKNLKLKLRS
jgi:O-antigen/teichoic acid export membrane protein